MRNADFNSFRPIADPAASAIPGKYTTDIVGINPSERITTEKQPSNPFVELYEEKMQERSLPDNRSGAILEATTNTGGNINEQGAKAQQSSDRAVRGEGKARPGYEAKYERAKAEGKPYADWLYGAPDNTRHSVGGHSSGSVGGGHAQISEEAHMLQNHTHTDEFVKRLKENGRQEIDLGGGRRGIDISGVNLSDFGLAELVADDGTKIITNAICK